MKIKVDLAKFKKLHQDEHHVTLKHPDGHEFKVAIKALNPMNRKNLDDMEMHQDTQKFDDGGQVQDPSRKKTVGELIGYPGSTPSKPNMAQGGKVNNDKQKGKPLDIEPIPDTSEPIDVELKAPLDVQPLPPTQKANGGSITRRLQDSNYADGGQVGYNAIKKENYKKQKMGRAGYADGGDINYDQLIPDEQADNAPYGASIPQNSDQNAPSSGQMTVATPQTAQSGPTQQANVNIPGVTDQQDAPPQQAQPGVPNTPSAMQAPQSRDVEAPTTLGGYENQAQAIQKEADAQAKMAKEQEAIQKSKIQSSMNIMDKFQDHYNQIDQERQALVHDIQNDHIDPNRYLGSMDTEDRTLTAISVALGGLGNGPNIGYQMLQNNINRDIEAQKADLGKKENLLNANFRQFGNLREATDMTRVMMNDITATKLQQSIDKAQSPIAKARGQQLLGQLQSATAPIVQQMAMRQMLASSSANGQGLQGADPAQFVPSLVPESRQKDVYGEIKRAQDTRQVAATALSNYDKVANQMKSVGGLGRIGTALYNPAEMQALNADLGTTVGDMEGSVREMAMNNVRNAYMPRSTDTADRLAARRQQLVHYLALKSSAPTARSYGIDLEKFGTTASQPINQLNPQQKSFAEWAKRNPNDPRAKIVLKKLGLD